MGRPVGSTAAKTKAVLDWIDQQLDDNPVIPNSILRTGLSTEFGLSRSRAFELIKKARDARDAGNSPLETWEAKQVAYYRFLLTLENELRQSVYRCKQAGNERGLQNATRQLLEVGQRILNYSPEKTFGAQSEHRAALQAAKAAHLADPLPWD